MFKISHYGSETGYSADIWHRMLRPGAHAILTPFSRGSVLLPTEKGTERISVTLTKPIRHHIYALDRCDAETRRLSGPFGGCWFT